MRDCMANERHPLGRILLCIWHMVGLGPYVEMPLFYLFLSKTKCLEKGTKSGRKDKTEGKNKIEKRKFTGRSPCHPWGAYADFENNQKDGIIP